jgi:hypothetical protein
MKTAETPALIILSVEVPEDAPVELKEAVARRNRASATGTCECGAVVEIVDGPDADGLARGVIVHEDGCCASDEALDAVIKRAGWKS